MADLTFFQRLIISLAKSYEPEAPSVSLEKGEPAAFNALPTIFGSFPMAGSSPRKYGTGVSFEVLKEFSINYDIARACINHRKRQISNLKWKIVAKNNKTDVSNDPRAEQLVDFFNRPSANTDFKTFTDKMLDDMLVYDGITLWKDRARGGKLLGLLNVDTATMRIKVMEDGTLPLPPGKAYTQIINGQVMGEWSTDEMYYKIFNPRTSTPYGLGPLESLLIGVDSALKSQMYNLSVLSEGGVPEGFYRLPKEMTTEDIKKFQTWFDALIAGNPRFQNRIKFMPGGEGTGFEATKKPADMQFMLLEQWLMKKTCAMFEVQPRDIGFEDNAQPGSAEAQHQSGLQRGLIPTALFLKSFFDEVIRYEFKMKDLEFEWEGLQADDDEFELKETDTLVRLGALTIDEVRTERGMQPFNIESTQKPIMVTSSGPILLETVTVQSVEEGREAAQGTKVDPNTEDDDETKAAIAEMRKWRRKAVASYTKNNKLPEFNTEYINNALKTLITSRLSLVKNVDEIREAFDPFIESLERDLVIAGAVKMDQEVSRLKRTHYGSSGQNTERK